MKTLALTTAAIELTDTPFLPGFNAVASNPTAAAISLTGSDDNSTFTALVTVPADGYINVDELPKYVKASAAGAYLLGGV